MKVRFLRSNNDRENKEIEELLVSNNLKEIKIELTSPILPNKMPQ